MNIHNCIFFTSLLSVLFSVTVNAQRPGQNPSQDPKLNPIGSSNIRDTTQSEVLPLDTPVAMTYVLISDPDHLFSFTDTFTWSDNKHYPVPYYRSHLGNYGSASRSLYPDVSLKSGFSTGWDQFDPYYVNVDSFRFYNQNVPVVRAKYSQASQNDIYFSLDFGRSFAKGISLSLSYDKINQEGEFAHQIQKNTGFGVGVWHNASSGKYDAFYNYISNTAIGEDNGGISQPELIGDPQIPNEFIPVFLSSGLTTHKFRYFTTKQIFHLLSDSTNLGIDLLFQGHISSDLYKYVDAAPPLEYYSNLFLVDPRGIRQFTEHNETEFRAGIGLPWKSAHSKLQSWIRYRSIDLNQEPEERKINELYWDASASFQWIEPLLLKGFMSFGLAQATDNFVFNAQGILDTRILGKLEGFWSVVSRKPYLVESKLFVNQQLVYDFQFQNPFTTEFGVAWNWDKQELHASIGWMIYDNFIFFDSSRKPMQLNESFSLRKFRVRKNFDFRWIGAKADLIWQPDARVELAIPEFLYYASLYGRLKLFKRKLIVMPGIDVTYHEVMPGVSYFPVTGRYHLLQQGTIPEYLRVDASVGIHINFLKAFIRVEDLAGLRTDRVLYQADYYPHYPGYIRIGIETGFYN